MANAKIRAPSIFIAGKKQGTFEGHKYGIETGNERQYGDGGDAGPVIGFSQGAIITSLSANGIVPIAGGDAGAIVTGLLAGQDYKIGIGVIEGKIHQITMTCTKAEFTGSQKAGTLMGDFEFIGGKPKTTG